MLPPVQLAQNVHTSPISLATLIIYEAHTHLYAFLAHLYATPSARLRLPVLFIVAFQPTGVLKLISLMDLYSLSRYHHFEHIIRPAYGDQLEYRL
jgi:hypothetical protein